MAHEGVVGFVRRLADPTCYAGARDDELIGWFTRERDAAAFEVLVRRHTGLVRSAVSRVLANAADIDDATQATFLVLLKRADHINWRTELGPWLYGVAHRVAVRLRGRNCSLPGRLAEVDLARAAPAPDLCWREACAILHAELDRLPDQYRLPLLLCYLEGQTRDEAAAALGVSIGTIKGRVRRGCEQLRRRLARRGVSLSASLLVAVASSGPVTAGSSILTATAIRAVASPRVTELVTEVTRAMIPVTYKTIALGLVAALSLVVAAGFVVADNSEPPRRPVTAPAPVLRRMPALFLVQDAKGLHFIDASGREKERPEPAVNIGALSPDGHRIAGWEHDKEAGRSKLVIRTRGKPEEATIIPLITGKPGRSGGTVIWARDGRRVAIWENAVTQDGTREYACRIHELASLKNTDIKLPDGYAVQDWSADGKRFLVDLRPTESTVRMAWIKANGTGKPEFVSPEKEIAFGGRLSPDGRRVLYLGCPEPPEGEYPRLRLSVLDLGTKKRTVVDEPGSTTMNGYCWSPDSKRIAYTWQKPLPPEGTRKRETFLITCAVDGSDRKILTSRKYEIPENSNASPKGQVSFFWVHDWR